jgi:DNA invertase Pin-like site-specific DNA recombinase
MELLIVALASRQGSGFSRWVLRAAGCTTKIYREKVTGAHNDRRELLKMLKNLAPGDVVTVTRIDRLARMPQSDPKDAADIDAFVAGQEVVDEET